MQSYVEPTNSLCLFCDKLGLFYYNNTCVKTCPDNYKADTTKNCQNCTGFIYINVCYDVCPEETTKNETTMTCIYNSIDVYNDTNSNCGSGQYYDEILEICVSYNSTDLCNPNPCKNEGNCTISYNDVLCECPDGTIGYLCQYNSDEIELVYKTYTDLVYSLDSTKPLTDEELEELLKFNALVNQNSSLVDEELADRIYMLACK